MLSVSVSACLLFNCRFICVPQSSLGLSINVTSASEYQFSVMSFWDFMWRFVSSAASGASLMCWCPLRLRVITGCSDKLNLIFTVSIVTACLSFFLLHSVQLPTNEKLLWTGCYPWTPAVCCHFWFDASVQIMNKQVKTLDVSDQCCCSSFKLGWLLCELWHHVAVERSSRWIWTHAFFKSNTNVRFSNNKHL